MLLLTLLGEPGEVVCTFLGHIKKARRAVDAVDGASSQATEQGTIGIAEFDP